MDIFQQENVRKQTLVLMIIVKGRAKTKQSSAVALNKQIISPVRENIMVTSTFAKVKCFYFCLREHNMLVMCYIMLPFMLNQNHQPDLYRLSSFQRCPPH